MIQDQAKDYHRLSQEFAALQQAHNASIGDCTMMRQDFEALSMSAAQIQRDLMLERLRTVKAETRLFESQRECRKAEGQLELEREKIRRAEETIKRLEGMMGMQGAQSAGVLEAAAYVRYRSQWDFMRRLAGSSQAQVQGPVFKFSDVPWPMFRLPATPEDITKGEVQRFLRASPGSKTEKSTRKVVKEWLLVWHPDKFCGR
jgi:hypothetical protein